MKKQILLPILVVMTMGMAPLKAVNGKSNFVKIDDDKTNAAALNDQAAWTIVLNMDNSDSLNFAIKLCNQAIDLDPELIDAFFNRGDANYFLHDYTTALKDFDVAVEKRGEPNDFQYRGECKFNLGDNTGALLDYQSAVAKGISNTASGQSLAMEDANELGIALYNAGNYSDAVAAFTISINAEKNKDNVFNRGNSEYMMGDRQSALADWKQSGKMGNKDGRKSYRQFRKEK